MAYTTAQNVRDILGVDSDTAATDIVEGYIEYSQKIVMKFLQVPVLDEEMTGNLDGVNNTYSVMHLFIADTSANTVVNTLDVSIYLWPDSDDEFTKVQVTSFTFNPETGVFVLTDIPASTYEKITCSYSYYTSKIDWKLVELACTYYSAMMWVQRELFLVPTNVYIGNIRTISSKPWEYLRHEFQRMIDLLVAAPMDKVTYRKMVFDPRSPLAPSVETTVAKSMKRYSPRVRTKEMGGDVED